MTNERLMSGRAWDDFCEQIRQAGHVVESFGDVDELERTEWYRFVTRLMRNGLERYVENCEPENPRIRDATWRTSINFQSPDQDHYLAEFVDGTHSYRIRGNKGGVPYFVVAAWSAPMPENLATLDWAPQGADGLRVFNPALLRTTAMLQSQAIDFDEHGNFEVLVGQQPPAESNGRNFLPITPDCVGLLVRVVYHLREREAAPQFAIERMDGVRPVPLDATLMSANLAKVAQWTRGYTQLVCDWWQKDLGLRPNRLRFSRQVYLSNGGVPDRHHGFGAWEINADEALVLEFTPAECDYWIFQLCTIWQENLDSYEFGQGYVTKYRARFEADESVRIIVAARNPGVAGNWIDPMGHRRGGWSLRLIQTDAPPPSIKLYRIPVAELEADGLSVLMRHEPAITGERTD